MYGTERTNSSQLIICISFTAGIGLKQIHTKTFPGTCAHRCLCMQAWFSMKNHIN